MERRPARARAVLVAAVYAYFVDPHPSRRRTVTVSLLFGAMALDVLYGRYLQAWLDAAETAQYAENALGLHVDLLSVLFVLAQRGRPRASALQRVPQPESGKKSRCRGPGALRKASKTPECV